MLILLLIASFAVRALTLVAPRVLMWDGAIYVGMGKYIFSHGTIGYWESFRPIIWPAILGLFWKLHLDPYSVGVYIQVIAGVAAVYITYKIGEKVKRGSGIYAAAIFSFTPIFVAFTVAPLTDIPSVALALGALYLFLEEHFLSAGILVACAFLFRFPQILIGLPLGCMALVYFFRDKRQRPLFRFLLGVMPILLAFLILNTYLYHDPLFPIHRGTVVTATSTGPYDHFPFFYSFFTIAENPFVVFIIVAAYVWIRKARTTLRNNAQMLTLLSALIIGMYFSLFPHKELRYSIAFLPYLALIAGFGIQHIFGKIRSRYTQPIITIIIIASLIFISIIQLKDNYPVAVPKDQQEFIDYFHTLPHVRVISSSPQIIVHNDIHVTSISDTWEDLYSDYQDETIPRDYVALDTCQLSCLSTNGECTIAKESLLSDLKAHQQLVFSRSVSNSCQVFIYKINQ
jgi:hypothetical protein